MSHDANDAYDPTDLVVDAYEPTALVVSVTTLAQLALAIPAEHVARYREELERYETVMPILDPTAYRDRSGNIPEHRQLMRAFAAFRREIEAMRPVEATDS